MSTQICSDAALLNETVQTLLVTSDNETAIEQVLRLVGQQYHVSRVYIFENSTHEAAISNTHEWCASGIPSEKARWQRFPLAVLDDSSLFNEAGICSVEDVAASSHKAADCLRPDDVQAILQVTLLAGGRKVGFIGFDDCTSSREWTAAEISTLSVLARILGGFVFDARPDHRSRINRVLAFNSINDFQPLVYAVDVEDLKLLYVNARVLEAVPDVELGRPCYRYLRPEGGESPCPYCPVLAYRRNPDISRTCFEAHNPTFNLWTKYSSSILDWGDRKVCFICATDLTDKRRHDIKMEHLAYTDEITGLPNNRRFERDGPALIQSAAQRDLNVAVVTLRLKNPHHGENNQVEVEGHQGKVFRAFVNAVNRMISGESLFVRVQGNLFAILYPHARGFGRTHIEARLRRLRSALDTVQLPPETRGRLALNAGVSLYPEDGETFESLVHKSRLALFSGERAGSPCFFYNAVVTADQAARDSLAQELSSALRKGELELFYQPKVNVRTSHICGMEALVRWHHPDRGLLPGGAIIPLAEERGMIAEIDEWGINEVCRHLRILRDTGCEPVPAAINLSPDIFYRDDLLERLQEALRRHDVPPSLLVVEVTEPVLLENLDKAAAIMEQIRAAGIRISIDNFGTGYSSLTCLRKLPIDAITLDRSFLADLEHSPEARGFVEIAVRLAHLLKASAGLEGVENASHIRLARELGCDMVQGYYTGRPEPLSQIATRISIDPARRSSELTRTDPSWLSLDFLRRNSLWLLACGGFFASGMLGQHLMDAHPASGIIALLAAGGGILSFCLVAVVALRRRKLLKARYARAAAQIVRRGRALAVGAIDPDANGDLPETLREVNETMTATAQQLHSRDLELVEKKASLEQMRTRLREEQEKYRVIAEKVTDILWELRLASGIMTISRPFPDFPGFARHDLAYPDEVLTCLHPQDRDKLIDYMQQLEADLHAIESLEIRLLPPGGGQHRFRLTGAAVCNEEGVPVSLAGVLSPLPKEAAILREAGRKQ